MEWLNYLDCWICPGCDLIFQPLDWDSVDRPFEPIIPPYEE